MLLPPVQRRARERNSPPLIHVECHETRVTTVTTNNVVSRNDKTDYVIIHAINEFDRYMYPVMENGNQCITA